MKFLMRPEQSRWQVMSDRAWQLIVRRDVDLIEVASGVLMFAWGMQLLLPWSTFATSTSYGPMAELAEEWKWGLLISWVGFTQVGAYLLDQWRVRLASNLGAVLVWTFLGVMFGYSNPYGTGIIVYPFLALVTALVYWRILTHRIDQ